MRIKILALAAALAALPGAGPAPQSGDGVAWVGSWEEAKEEAQERNVPIFITIQQDDNPSCQQMESAFRDNSWVNASRRAVCLVANPDTKHGVREVMINKRKMPMCRAYEGITCDVHTRCQSVIGHFIEAKSGTFDIPMQIWCRPNGTKLFEVSGPNGGGTQSSASLVKDLERALDRVSGPKLSRKEWMDLRKLLMDGDEAVNKQEYKFALACYKRVMETRSSDKYASRGKERYENFIRQMVGMVSKALKQYEKYPKDSKESKEVKPLLMKIAKEMRGTEAAKAAEDALKQIK